MNKLNIIIILTILIKLNECNEIEKLKKEMHNLKQNFEYLGQQMSRRVTEFKEEVANDMETSFIATNKFMARLERDLERSNSNNDDLNLKFNQTLNELDSNIKNNELFKKQAGIFYLLFLLTYFNKE
jgi:ferredoxin-NADP reductase